MLHQDDIRSSTRLDWIVPLCEETVHAHILGLSEHRMYGRFIVVSQLIIC